MDEDVRQKLMESLHVLGEIYVRSHIAFCAQTSSRMPSDPCMLATVIHLIDCAVILGRQVDIIDAYDATFEGCEESLCALYTRFELYADEKAFVETAKHSSRNGTSVIFNLQTFEEYDQFVKFIVKKYRQAIEGITRCRLRCRNNYASTDF